MLVFVVAVEFARERDAVAAVLHRDAATGEEVVAEVADTRLSVRQFGGGVLDGSLGRLVIIGSACAGPRPEQDVPLRVLDAAVRAELAVGAAAVGVELRSRAREERVAVALVRGHDVDQAAHRVRSVEQRRGAANDLDPLGRVRVDGHAVIAGLAGEVAGSDAVLQNQHAVAVEAADYGAAGSGAEAPAGDARFLAQRVAQASLRVADDVERVKRRYRVERLERGLRPGDRSGDGHVFVDGRQPEREVYGRVSTGRNAHRLPSRRQVLALRKHLVVTRRHVLDREHPLFVGQRERSGPDHQNHRPVDRVSRIRQRHRAAYRAGFLCGGGRGHAAHHQGGGHDRRHACQSLHPELHGRTPHRERQLAFLPGLRMAGGWPGTARNERSGNRPPLGGCARRAENG